MAKEVELIKEKIELVDFLRSYLKLSPAGKNFKALCPFHQEKTPSFVISPERQIWYCFGACGEGGDIVKFVMKYENLDFREALRFLAERAGLPIQTISPSEQKEFGILYDIHEKAKDFFKQELLKNKEALEYLKSRKLGLETIEEFELGYAAGGEALTLHLLKTGYDVNDIARAGLVHKNTKGLYRDRFQERIVFPIFNHLGKTVAFSGRLAPFAKSTIVDLPKYLNSPETPIFNKSKILYGFNKAKTFIAESRTVFLVEGQMDFLMSWQSGVKNAVAVSGTGLTPHHLERIRRTADTVVLSFDNDEAGLKALERSLDIFNNFDFHVKVLNLGEYKDPAEACEKDPSYLKQALEWAKPAFSHLFSVYFGGAPQTSWSIPDKKRIIRYLLLKIKNLRSAIEQNIWLKELARHSNISEPALLTEMVNLPSAKSVSEPAEEIVIARERINILAERLLALALAKKETFLPMLQSVLNLLPVPYQAVVNNPADEKWGVFEMRGAFEFSDIEDGLAEKEFQALLNHLKIESLKKESFELKREMQLAEEKGEEDKLIDLMAKFNERVGEISDLKRLTTL